MVDFLLHIEPKHDASPSDAARSQERIDALRRSYINLSINHTDLHAVRAQPIAVSIETKRTRNDWDKATLQMGTWQAAQFRAMPRPVRPAIDFLPGVIVQGHDCYLWRASRVLRGRYVPAFGPSLRQLAWTASAAVINRASCFKLICLLDPLRQACIWEAPRTPRAYIRFWRRSRGL